MHKGGIIKFDMRVEGRVKGEKEGLKRWVEFSHSIGKGGAEETESPKPRRLKQKGKRELLENGEYLSTTGLLYYSKRILGLHNGGEELIDQRNQNYLDACAVLNVALNIHIVFKYCDSNICVFKLSSCGKFINTVLFIFIFGCTEACGISSSPIRAWIWSRGQWKHQVLTTRHQGTEYFL